MKYVFDVERDIMENVIVTGATSFIGISLINRLMRKNINVYAIARPHSSRLNCIPDAPNVHIIESELDDLAGLVLPVKNCDVLYHIAWSSDFISPRFNIDGQMINVRYAENAMKLAEKHRCTTFLGVGSQAECGLIDGCITSSTKPNPKTAYAIAKVAAYDSLMNMCSINGMKLCWPRLLSAYGPYDRPHTLIMSLLSSCFNNKSIALTQATQIWDYIYIDDVAEAIYQISEKGHHAKRYPIGSGVGRSLRSYIEEIAQITGNDNILTGIGKKEYASGQVMNLLADMSDVYHDTGFICQETFSSGIRKTIDFMKENSDIYNI